MSTWRLFSNSKTWLKHLNMYLNQPLIRAALLKCMHCSSVFSMLNHKNLNLLDLELMLPFDCHIFFWIYLWEIIIFFLSFFFLFFFNAKDSNKKTHLTFIREMEIVSKLKTHVSRWRVAFSALPTTLEETEYEKLISTLRKNKMAKMNGTLYRYFN